MTIPNMPAADTPVGSSDADNPVVRTWREPAKFAFEPQAHWDIGEKLNILDVERAGKVSGARFTFLPRTRFPAGTFRNQFLSGYPYR